MTRSLTSCVYSGRAVTAANAEARADRKRAVFDRAAAARNAYAANQIADTLAIRSARSTTGLR